MQTPRLFVSARAGTGIASLRAALAAIVSRDRASDGGDSPLAEEAET